MVLKLIIISLLYIHVYSVSLLNEKPYYDIESAVSLFADFVKTYNKSYDSEEYKKRFEIFVESLETINKLNEEHETATFGINVYSDMRLMEKSSPKLDMPEPAPIPANFLKGIVDVPKSIDWRKQNVLNPVKNDFTCMSDWAFTAVDLIESQYALEHGKLLQLSVQQFVDCDHVDLNCFGGVTLYALKYAKRVGGVMLDKDYQYHAVLAKCLFDANKIAVDLETSNSIMFDKLTEDDLAKLIAAYGPVAVEIVHSHSIKHYKSGIVDPTDCGVYPADRFKALIVGYGTEKDVPYWIVRMYKGEDFGEKGYFRIVRGKNLCLISRFVTILMYTAMFH